MLQLVGAVQITTINPTDRDALSKSNRAKRIAEIGVAVQLIFFGLFSVIAVRFNFTSKRFASEFEERITLVTVGGDVEGNNKKGEKYVKIDGGEKILKRNWQSILRVVNVASVCILVCTYASLLGPLPCINFRPCSRYYHSDYGKVRSQNMVSYLLPLRKKTAT